MAKITGLCARLMAERYQEVFLNKGYAFFENGDFNLNIVGVRNDSGDASKFDDFIKIFYKVDKEWVCNIYPATTEPGTSILRRPIKAVRHKGTAILVPGQYRSTYRIGTHGGKRSYTALVQRGAKVSVWRDNNRDSKPDYHGPEEEGWFGINIHKHWGSDARVNTGGVSAGCQVFQSSQDFYEFMDICEQAADRWGNSFTYTLLEERDIKNFGVENVTV